MIAARTGVSQKHLVAQRSELNRLAAPVAGMRPQGEAVMARTLDRAYTIREAAEILAIPRSTLYDLVRRRAIDAVRYGEGRRRSIRIETLAIKRFLDQHRVPARSRDRGSR